MFGFSPCNSQATPSVVTRGGPCQHGFMFGCKQDWILAGISSGPAALFGFSPCNSQVTPSVVTRGGPCQHGFMFGCKQWSNDINESN